MNGVIDIERIQEILLVRFSCPFVQKRLFDYFSDELFGYMGKIHEPFEDMSNTITEKTLNIRNLMRRFEIHLKKNREWLLDEAPRRKDMRIFEAVFHFNLYRYLCEFLESKHAKVWPEFPTGNGKIDILIKYAECTYALELKTYTDEGRYRESLKQAAAYGKQLGLLEVSLIFFVEYIDDANREKYEAVFADKENNVLVKSVFVTVGD